MKLTKTCAKFLRRHGGTILAVLASAGVVATAVETSKATIKAQKLIEMNTVSVNCGDDSEPAYTPAQKVKDCWKFYLPAAILGGGTIACILGSNALNKKQIASLTAAYMALGKTYQEYRRQVVQEVGHEKEADIRDMASKDVQDIERNKYDDSIRLFYEPTTQRYFHATMADVIQASYYFNRCLAVDGAISVNEWCTYICSDELPVLPDGDEKGWCMDQLVEDYDMLWMDFEYDVQTTDDGLTCYYLAPYLDPIADYLNYDPQNHPF